MDLNIQLDAEVKVDFKFGPDNQPHATLKLGDIAVPLTPLQFTQLTRSCVANDNYATAAPPFALIARTTHDTDGDQSTPHYHCMWSYTTLEARDAAAMQLEFEILKFDQKIQWRFDVLTPAVPEVLLGDLSDTVIDPPIGEVLDTFRAVANHYYELGAVFEAWMDAPDPADEERTNGDRIRAIDEAMKLY